VLLISTSWLVGWSYFIISSQIISYHQSHIWSSIINLILSRKKRNNTRCDWFSLTIHHYLGDSPFPPSPLLPQNLQTSLLHLHPRRHCCYYWNPSRYHVYFNQITIKSDNLIFMFSLSLFLDMVQVRNRTMRLLTNQWQRWDDQSNPKINQPTNNNWSEISLLIFISGQL